MKVQLRLCWPDLNHANALKVAFQNPFSDAIVLSEITTDELIAPTRGTDSYDNKSNGSNFTSIDGMETIFDYQCSNTLNGVVFAATDISCD